jgi:hypothetical protein
MEPSKEVINVRLCQLNGQLLGRGVAFAGGSSASKRLLTKETLLDALNVLYDECNNDSLKKNDEFITKFVEKCESKFIGTAICIIKISQCS